jgi:chromosome segregation ATPase
MKLSKRITDVLRANLASLGQRPGPGQARPPAQLEKQLEHIRRSLTQATGRKKRLDDELALAEQEGRGRDAIRLEREITELDRSMEGLRATLDTIEAHVEMAQRSGEQAPGETPPRKEALDVTESESDEKAADLSARKSRLSAPGDKKK